MYDKCVNNFMGYCDPNGEYAIENCPFAGPYIEETHRWIDTDKGYKPQDLVTLVIHYGIPYCTAKPSDLIEMEDECWHCNGTPEYDDNDPAWCFCPVDYPEECPRK